MAKPRSSKRDVARAKKERAELKRDRRQRAAAAESEQSDGAQQPEVRPAVSAEEVIERLGRLHVSFEAEEIDFDENEQAKGELLALISD